jgi:hypothetical protein
VRDGQIFPPTLRRCLRPLSDTCSRDSDPHFAVMRKYIRNSPYMLPVTMVILTAASWETTQPLDGARGVHDGRILANG